MGIYSFIGAGLSRKAKEIKTLIQPWYKQVYGTVIGAWLFAIGESDNEVAGDLPSQFTSLFGPVLLSPGGPGLPPEGQLYIPAGVVAIQWDQITAPLGDNLPLQVGDVVIDIIPNLIERIYYSAVTTFTSNLVLATSTGATSIRIAASDIVNFPTTGGTLFIDTGPNREQVTYTTLSLTTNTLNLATPLQLAHMINAPVSMPNVLSLSAPTAYNHYQEVQLQFPGSALLDAKNDMFLATAGGTHLSILGNNYGVQRPTYNQGDDEQFRKLIPLLSWARKGVLSIFYAILNVVIGDTADSTLPTAVKVGATTLPVQLGDYPSFPSNGYLYIDRGYPNQERVEFFTSVRSGALHPPVLNLATPLVNSHLAGAAVGTPAWAVFEVNQDEIIIEVEYSVARNPKTATYLHPFTTSPVGPITPASIPGTIFILPTVPPSPPPWTEAEEAYNPPTPPNSTLETGSVTPPGFMGPYFVHEEDPSYHFTAQLFAPVTAGATSIQIVETSVPISNLPTSGTILLDSAELDGNFSELVSYAGVTVTGPNAGTLTGLVNQTDDVAGVFYDHAAGAFIDTVISGLPPYDPPHLYEQGSSLVTGASAGALSIQIQPQDGPDFPPAGMLYINPGAGNAEVVPYNEVVSTATTATLTLQIPLKNPHFMGEVVGLGRPVAFPSQYAGEPTSSVGGYGVFLAGNELENLEQIMSLVKACGVVLRFTTRGQ